MAEPGFGFDRDYVQNQVHGGKPLYKPATPEPDSDFTANQSDTGPDGFLEHIEIYFTHGAWRISAPKPLFCEGGSGFGACIGDSGGCCTCTGRLDFFKNATGSAAPPTSGWQVVPESWNEMKKGHRMPKSPPSILYL